MMRSRIARARSFSNYQICEQGESGTALRHKKMSRKGGGKKAIYFGLTEGLGLAVPGCKGHKQLSQRSCRAASGSVSDQKPISHRVLCGDERLAKADEHD